MTWSPDVRLNLREGQPLVLVPPSADEADFLTGLPGLNSYQTSELGSSFDDVAVELHTLPDAHSVIFAASAPLAAFNALSEAEQAYGVAMTDARRQEYASGRIAASLALKATGVECPSVLADRDGVPVFPNGYMGSIAHKHGRAIAVVTTSRAVRGLGIDLEFDEASNEAELLGEVIGPSEQDEMPVLMFIERELRSPATLMIAIKEAIYKAVFPSHRVRFGFSDIVVTLNPATRSFTAVHFPADTGLTVRGHYRLSSRWLIAVACATAQASSQKD